MSNSSEQHQDEGLDFSGYGSRKQTELQNNQPLIISEDEPADAGGFIIKGVDRLSGGKINSISTIKIVLVFVSIIFVLIAIVAYMYIGTPAPNQQMKFVPNPSPPKVGK
jgi:hypothetical protein